MATVVRTSTFRPPVPSRLSTTSITSKSAKPLCLPFKQSSTRPSRLRPLRFSSIPSLRFVKFVPFAYNGETEITEVQELGVEDSSDGAISVEDQTSDDTVVEAEETPTSPLLTLFQSYKEALANNDESKVADVESLLKSIEEEKVGLEGKVASLSEELSAEKTRILRISADFENFRKRTERDRLSVVTNAQGEVVESLLSVLDNFERAKSQIKVETEGEEKINNSYQSIYKQFMEILGSLGVVPVETIGNSFDPLLHEAIMREDSAEYEEGIIIEEYRKGFRLGDRLLRPSMVKVSAGPGPAKPEQVAPPEDQATSESSEESTESTETESA
ncbi:GrpE protein-like [Quillaja saponaria]|uniref:GrpE protein homolog n=1 Tax=Quillaja saponaria TaxID=32244 RepID=A0AAD7PZD7_QUISA|nr:GrpE protein-like [Quillaja saponaria]